MHRMEVGMVTDSVLLERGNDIVAPAPLQHARLFPNHFERRANPTGSEHFGQALARIVIRRQEIILRVKPEDYVHRSSRRGRLANGLQRDQQTEEERAEDFGAHLRKHETTTHSGQAQTSLLAQRRCLTVPSASLHSRPCFRSLLLPSSARAV